MWRRTRFVFAFLLFTAAMPAMAGTPIVVGETVKIPSKILGEERTILVGTPDGYARGQTRYPVLYLTDGEVHFQEARATADFLRRNGFMPAVLVVGVTNTDRTRDLAPPGADRFLDFFEKELVPFIEANYRTVPFRIFCGHSLGGLFGVHALITRPDLFHAVIAASPALVWDGGSEIRRMETFLATKRSLKRTFFMTTGTEGPESRAAFDALLKVFEKSRPDGFRVASAVFPEEDHFSVVLESHYAGLKKLFDGWHISRKSALGDLEAGSLADLKTRFAALSERVGFSFPPPEALVNLLGRQALGRNEPERALEFYRYNVETYPDSADAREALAKALAHASP
ncbi:MAG: alpha/beta hydrolase [Thermoanaerobaculia bacterium]